MPVLSEQITVVLPSASTAGSLRMMARRLAMRETPIASVIVTAAGNPSGMAPTANATAAMNMSKAASPRSRPTAKVSSASPPMTSSSKLEKAAIFFVSGVCRSGTSAISFEMRPVSVAMPVAATSPAPWPLTTMVPA